MEKLQALRTTQVLKDKEVILYLFLRLNSIPYYIVNKTNNKIVSHPITPKTKE